MNEVAPENKEIINHLLILQRAAKAKPIGVIEDSKSKGWKCLSVAVDSGACDNVIDPSELPAYEGMVKETQASLMHDDFVAANGETIPNYGELKIPIITREKTLRSICFQAAGVSKGLLSVEKMNESGHFVVFDGDDSYIANKKTGEINRLRREDGNFMMDIWVPPPHVAEASGFGGHR